MLGAIGRSMATLYRRFDRASELVLGPLARAFGAQKRIEWHPAPAAAERAGEAEAAVPRAAAAGDAQARAEALLDRIEAIAGIELLAPAPAAARGGGRFSAELELLAAELRLTLDDQRRVAMLRRGASPPPGLAAAAVVAAVGLDRSVELSEAIAALRLLEGGGEGPPSRRRLALAALERRGWLFR